MGELIIVRGRAITHARQLGKCVNFPPLHSRAGRRANWSAAKGFAAFLGRVVPGGVPTKAGRPELAVRKAVMLTALQNAVARYGTLAKTESLPDRFHPGPLSESP